MERAIAILPTNDLAAARAFYVDGLGFRVTFEASAGGRTGLLGLQRGTIELTLDCPMDGHGRNACVSLHVTDVDAYYQEWSAKVTPLRPPKNEEWGARTFDLLDPSGNTLFVIGPSVNLNSAFHHGLLDESRLFRFLKRKVVLVGKNIEPLGESEACLLKLADDFLI